MAQSYKIDRIKTKKELKVKDIKQKEIKKKQDKIKHNKTLIIMIILLLICIFSGAFGVWFKEYNKPTNKLKRYLINNGYECGKSTCHKTKDNITYTISYKKDNYQMVNELYTLNITKKIPYIIMNGKTKTCSYEKEDYEPLSLIDDTFEYDKDCAKYIDDINKNIKEYKNILSNARISIDDLNE